MTRARLMSKSFFGAAWITAAAWPGLACMTYRIGYGITKRKGTMKELSLNLLPHPPADTHGTCNRSTTPTMGTWPFEKSS